MRIVIPVYDGVDLLDVCGPAECLSWPKPAYDVDLVAELPGTVTSRNGIGLQVPQGLGTPTPCDALWVPGGDPVQLSRMIHDPQATFLDFLVAQAKVSTYVCSVCEGALLIAAAGLLDGYSATTHWAFIPYLQQNHPAVTVADGFPRFVIDGNRLTGGGISSGLDASLALIELLSGTAAAQGAQQTTQYYPDPPVSSEIPHLLASPMPAWP